ncbi:MAG: SDR family NAD(P)-dependent oxidoreductase [Caldilineaceae bacterium]|nr:SDR family NAD(P)-dependent oxidoreductase [Caldilineaceae bacterium]MCY4089536.1 SDR family NAD(P)-dependent oxidoreductase [Caldilineaceae bacterium]MCY4118070.1 SDR family NAD(P)-dependent oxidoreductase [Caldilineaceae bacterium]MDE0431113.1 SDR family NAD(P)-dependent oxidoreductase [Caldilineaceae bacterium]
MKLANKVALITGGARGLGRAYVLHLAQLGADVVINDVDLDAARAYDEPLTAATVADEVEAFGRRALAIEADVSDKAAVEAMLRQTIDAFGRLDILVNNAGGMLYPPPNHSAATAPPDHYRYILDINLTGAIYCCQAAAPHMQAARSGKIVNVASQAGLWSGRDGGGMAYKVAKAGVIQYTRVLAAELGPHNIHVNCIAPGFMLSSRAVVQGRNRPPIRDRLLQDIPLGRLGMPEDCAKVVEFLVTDLSDYVTGQCIPVCGGYVAF